jgi:hypothetical protein
LRGQLSSTPASARSPIGRELDYGPYVSVTPLVRFAPLPQELCALGTLRYQAWKLQVTPGPPITPPPAAIGGR